MPNNGSMSRVAERLIDMVVLTELLGFAWLMRESDPALAGVVVAAAVQFWMAKNATVVVTDGKGDE